MTQTPPILFLVFNRPELTLRVFEQIRHARPSRLFVAADGPRAGVPIDTELCVRTRQIIQSVDWDCEVNTLYRENNLGCRQSVSAAIDWFFEHVESGIILEDDCLPHPTFFRFCAELLERYRDDERVMAISGDNFRPRHKRKRYSYYFSRYNHIWGWASWRRSWRYYDVTMQHWPELRDSGGLQDVLRSRRAAEYWTRMFQAVYEGKTDTWDYQWTFACWIQRGLTALPYDNLISNIGFNTVATHTTGDSKVASLEATSVEFPLQHPPSVSRDTSMDIYTENNYYSGAKTHIHRIKNDIKKVTRKFLKG